MHVCTHKIYMYMFYVIIISVEPPIKDTVLRTHKKTLYKGQKLLVPICLHVNYKYGGHNTKKNPLYKGRIEVTLLYFQRIFNLREEDTSLLRTKIVRPSMSFVPLYLCMQMFY